MKEKNQPPLLRDFSSVVLLPILRRNTRYNTIYFKLEGPRDERIQIKVNQFQGTRDDPTLIKGTSSPRL